MYFNRRQKERVLSVRRYCVCTYSVELNLSVSYVTQRQI